MRTLDEVSSQNFLKKKVLLQKRVFLLSDPMFSQYCHMFQSERKFQLLGRNPRSCPTSPAKSFTNIFNLWRTNETPRNIFCFTLFLFAGLPHIKFFKLQQTPQGRTVDQAFSRPYRPSLTHCIFSVYFLYFFIFHIALNAFYPKIITRKLYRTIFTNPSSKIQDLLAPIIFSAYFLSHI